MNEEDKIAAYKMLINVLNEDSSDKTEDDKLFRTDTKEQITIRDKEYTNLLKHFVCITRIRNYVKEICKWCFYLMVIVSICALVCITYLLFNKYLSTATVEQITDAIPLLITSLVGFVSAIISIPATIAKYLFSTKEDENITQIILHTQKHDTTGRQWAMDFKKFAENIEESSSEENKLSTNNLEKAEKKN